MSTTFRNKNNSGNDRLDDYLNKAEERAAQKRQGEEPKSKNNFVVVLVIVIVGIFLVRNAGNVNLNPIDLITQTAMIAQQPSEDLLNRMNSRMVEMGYAGLNHDDLTELRNEGVTATYISNVRGLGFTDLTVNEAVQLANADASSAFMAMMIELGYDLSVEDFVRLRQAGVTANYTSRVHDLGYRDVTVDQLVRMQRIGLSTSLIERLHQERGEDVELEEIIRYRISNQ